MKTLLQLLIAIGNALPKTGHGWEKLIIEITLVILAAMESVHLLISVFIRIWGS